MLHASVEGVHEVVCHHQSVLEVSECSVAYVEWWIVGGLPPAQCRQSVSHLQNVGNKASTILFGSLLLCMDPLNTAGNVEHGSSDSSGPAFSVLLQDTA